MRLFLFLQNLYSALLRPFPKNQNLYLQEIDVIEGSVRKALKKSDKFKDNDTLAFGEFLLLEHHIACVPGEAFGTPGFLRFSYATNDETIREGFKRLNTALNSIT